MLISRLVLNLRTYDQSEAQQHVDIDTGPSNSIQFADAGSRILGNIGAPLDHGQWTNQFVQEAASENGLGDSVVNREHYSTYAHER